MREYALTDEQFRSLAGGGGSPDAIGLLTEAQLSGRRLCLLAAAERRDYLPAALQDALSLVIEIDRASPHAGVDLLRYPFLSAWFTTLVPALTGGRLEEPVAARAAEGLGSLAAAIAISAGLPFEIVVPCAGPDLVLPRIGTAIGVGPAQVPVQSDGTTVTIGEALELPVPGDENRAGWRPAHLVQLPGHTLEIVDADPLRDRFSAAPLNSLPPSGTARFDRLVREAWQILDDEQPIHAAGMRIALRALVPLRAPAGASQVSASARGCFGALGFSIPDDPQTLAELMVHEFQHEKLGALLDLVDLCTAGGRARYHAPWRPDPRPAEALMQGVYAFTAVAGFWRARRSRRDGADFRYYSWRDQVNYALDQLLSSGELTPVGEVFFDALDATLATWRDETPTPTAVRLYTAAAQVSWRLAHHRPEPADVATLAAAWAAGAAVPAFEPPTVVAGSASSELTELLKEQAAWGEAGRARATEAECALLDGDHETALRLVPFPDDDREWTAAAVALHAHMGAAAFSYRRPELLRAVFDRLGDKGRRPGLTALHTWLSGQPA
ncbi:HEXXH motif-containing putative peptide modification protein [Actinoplanes sp. NPDC026619]|uniref:aKG-HExxH-type peptide beta-hydroxylase n=1 Tax=Actinoplanes sp. NPDC026619 TaxID=3155798 RepID=UPI0033DE0C3B